MLQRRFQIVMLGLSILLFSLVKAAEPSAADKASAAPILKTGAITHSNPERGIAAFVIGDGTQFKVGQPIALSYGVINVGLTEDKARGRTIVRPRAAADPDNQSWVSVIGPDGKELAYRGEYVSRKAVQPHDAVLLSVGGVVGHTSPDLNRYFDLKTPGMYRLLWHFEAGGIEGGWSGKIVSNELQFEIVP